MQGKSAARGAWMGAVASIFLATSWAARFRRLDPDNAHAALFPCMSRYEWQEGTFVLPSSEFASFRKQIQDKHHEVLLAAFDRTQKVWEGLSRKEKTDPVAYTTAAREALYGDSPIVSLWGERDHFAEEVKQHAYDMLVGAVRANGGKPRRVVKSDVDFPTNRTTVFEGLEASVHFDRRANSVTWEVAENNHAVERAQNSVLGQAFFARLDEVRWTRGTGGTIVGNDEYNTEDRWPGGGGNYACVAKGPIGFASAPFCCDPWVDPQGVKHTPKPGRNGKWSLDKVATRLPSPARPVVPASGSDLGRAAAGQVAGGKKVGGQFQSVRKARNDGVSLA